MNKLELLKLEIAKLANERASNTASVLLKHAELQLLQAWSAGALTYIDKNDNDYQVITEILNLVK